jgi:uncharacterized protein
MNYSHTVFYHKNCTDGFMAAYLMRNSFKNLIADWEKVTYLPVQYNDPTVIVETDVLWILDFSYSKEDLQKIMDTSPSLKKIHFMDHHKTAIDVYGETSGHYKECTCSDGRSVGLFSKLLNSRSGAGLALDHSAVYDLEIPARLRQAALAVEDRDLWLFKLDGTKIWNKVLNAEMTFEAWDKIFEMSEEEFHKVWTRAALELDFYEAECERLKGLITSVDTKLGKAALMNLDMKYVSNVADLVKDEYAFCAFFIVSPGRDLVIISLRSNSAGDVDVSAIAKHNGGGGHKNASGFSFPISDTEKFLRLVKCDFLP